MRRRKGKESNVNVLVSILWVSTSQKWGCFEWKPKHVFCFSCVTFQEDLQSVLCRQENRNGNITSLNREGESLHGLYISGNEPEVVIGPRKNSGHNWELKSCIFQGVMVVVGKRTMQRDSEGEYLCADGGVWTSSHTCHWGWPMQEKRSRVWSAADFTGADAAAGWCPDISQMRTWPHWVISTHKLCCTQKPCWEGGGQV